MKKKFRIVSLLLMVVLLMSVYVTPAAASQGKSKGQERGQERQDADQVQYLDVEVKVIDGQPVLRYETEEGYKDTPFEIPAYAISADGQKVAVKREGDAILLPTEDGPEAVPLEDFCVVMVNGQIMLLAEVNLVWKFPIAIGTVTAALKKAGVAVTSVTLYVAARLMLAGVAITKTTVTAGKALREAGRAITRASVDLVLRAMPIISQKLFRVQPRVEITAVRLHDALVDWLAGRCIKTWCDRPATRRGSFNPLLMLCAPCSP